MESLHNVVSVLPGDASSRKCTHCHECTSTLHTRQIFRFMDIIDITIVKTYVCRIPAPHPVYQHSSPFHCRP